MLNDVASEMVVPLLPVFLARTLGGGATAVGAIEGTAALVASLLKWAVGWWSDRTGVTRPFVLGGYVLAGASRPFLALATAPVHVLIVRVTDRIGKGLRSAPRDALLAASVDADQRGTAFGFHRSMDHLGAAIGPAIALVVLTFWTKDLRTLFLLAVIPGLLAAIAPWFTVEAKVEAPAAGSSAGRIDRRVWRVLVPIGLVTLGTASDSFLMLKAGIADTTPIEALPALWVVLHLVRTAVATPGGWLADRMSPRGIVSIGWAIRVAVFIGLAAATSPAAGGVGIVAYGFAGLSEGAEKKLVGAYADAESRGATFGAYYAVIGVMTLPASLGFGLVWDHVGPGAAFSLSASVIAAALAALWATRDA
ncbi:MAG: MFS transporter [Myxococcota bacterium]